MEAAAATARDRGVATGMGRAGWAEAPAPGPLAFLFSGQGSQRPRMGLGLAQVWPVFHEAFQGALAAVEPHLGEPCGLPLRTVLEAEPEAPAAELLAQAGYAQPALFALQVALAALWRSWGVEPAWVTGYGVGELAAAQVAGILSLEDAARLVATRARLTQALPPDGAMLAVSTPGGGDGEQLGELVAALAGLSVAARSGPDALVLSGDASAIEEAAAELARLDARVVRLAGSHALHSPRLEPMLGDFAKVARQLHYRAPQVRWVSGCTGRAGDAAPCTSSYWVAQVRDAVRFGDALATLRGKGVRRYLELGPRAQLLGLIPAASGTRIPSLRGSRREPEAILEALGACFVPGQALRWEAVFPGGRRLTPSPDRRPRTWLGAPAARRTAFLASSAREFAPPAPRESVCASEGGRS